MDLRSRDPSLMAGTEEIQGRIRAAARTRPLKIRGGGTWISAAADATSANVLDVSAHRGVSEYVPGNLTITVLAGTTMEEIEAVTSEEKQWLPLDPFGKSAGTIGATVATGSYGPLVSGFGTPRDLVLGIESVLGTGEVVRGGGRVVKNVAGYDLCRLFTGSWGTLGVITEVTLRLFAQQETEASIAIPLPARREKIVEIFHAVRTAGLHPWATEIVDASIARMLGVGDADLLVIRFGGNEQLVRSQLRMAKSFGPSQDIQGGFWKSLMTLEHGWSFRISSLPSRIVDTWEIAGRLVDSIGEGHRVGTPDRGVVRLLFPGDTDLARIQSTIKSFSGSNSAGPRITIESVPSFSPLQRFNQTNSEVDLLTAGIKKAFDPRNVLNSGLLPQ